MKKGKNIHNIPNDVDADPIHILMKEHEDALTYLRRLDAAVEYIELNGFSFEAFKDLAEAIHFIDKEVRYHNEKEEKYLFPLMERHVNGPAEAMHSEHRELWRAFNNLRECVKDVEEMKIYATTVRDLVQYSKLIVDLLTNHIAKENDVLFPMARNLLTKDEYEQLSNEIAGTAPRGLGTTIS